MAYTSPWKIVGCFPREIQSLLPEDCPLTPVPVPSIFLGPSVNQTSPLTTGMPGPLVHFCSPQSNPIFGFKIKNWPHNIDLHIIYRIWPLKLHQYVVISFWNVKVGPASQTQRRSAADLASSSVTRSSGGTSLCASIAPEGVVCIASAIPKHASLCILLSLFLALAIWQPGH